MNDTLTTTSEAFGIACFDAHKRLLIVRQGEFWGLPKGRPEPNDLDHAYTASREFREETGYSVPMLIKEPSDRSVKELVKSSPMTFRQSRMHCVSGIDRVPSDVLCVNYNRPNFVNKNEVKNITLFFAQCIDLDQLPLDNKRDSDIEEIKILDLAEYFEEDGFCWHDFVYNDCSKLHRHDRAAIAKLLIKWNINYCKFKLDEITDVQINLNLRDQIRRTPKIMKGIRV